MPPSPAGPSDDPDPDVLAHALRGRYRVEGQAGRGGMGTVFRARDQQLERPVAIKVLSPSRAGDPRSRSRFLAEARTAAAFSHPNIVPIHAVHEDASAVYYVMALVNGLTLGQVLAEGGPLPPMEAARVLREVAWALAYAHANQVVHRDIKPDNILVEQGSGRCLVTDFGIARDGSGRGDTGPREVVGTAEYMSPEQCAGRPVDARSDLYSLGVVGFQLLTGRLPFRAPDSQAMLHRHLTVEPPPVATLAPGTPRRLARVVDRCLRKHPAARFGRAEDLAEALTRVLQEHTAPPVAVRAFVTEGMHLAPWVWVFSLLTVPLAVLASVRLRPTAREPAAWLGAAVGVAAVLLGAAGVFLWRVRRFMASGHDRDEIVDLLQAEERRRREELLYAYGVGPSRLERGLRLVTWCGLFVAVGSVLVSNAIAQPARSLAVGASAGMVALVAAVLARLRTEQQADPALWWRLAFWRGAFVRWSFRVSGKAVEPETGDEGDARPVPGVPGDRFFADREPVKVRR